MRTALKMWLVLLSCVAFDCYGGGSREAETFTVQISGSADVKTGRTGVDMVSPGKFVSVDSFECETGKHDYEQILIGARARCAMGFCAYLLTESSTNSSTGAVESKVSKRFGELTFNRLTYEDLSGPDEMMLESMKVLWGGKPVVRFSSKRYKIQKNGRTLNRIQTIVSVEPGFSMEKFMELLNKGPVKARVTAERLRVRGVSGIGLDDKPTEASARKVVMAPGGKVRCECAMEIQVGVQVPATE